MSSAVGLTRVVKEVAGFLLGSFYNTQFELNGSHIDSKDDGTHGIEDKGSE